VVLLSQTRRDERLVLARERLVRECVLVPPVSRLAVHADDLIATAARVRRFHERVLALEAELGDL